MKIFPAIDLFEGQAVRLLRGDYKAMDVYSSDPLQVAFDFQRQGARCLHLVDLEGARSGGIPNGALIERIARETQLFTEVGGGIRSLETAERYLELGVDRVIFGTVAVTDPDLVARAVERFGERIAVGIDVRDGRVAIRGWTQTSEMSCFDLCRQMEKLGVKTIICTDIAKDGAMAGTNRELYRELMDAFSLNIIASGGVSTLEDVRALAKLGVEGAIIGRAYYTGEISLSQAVAIGEGQEI